MKFKIFLTTLLILGLNFHLVLAIHRNNLYSYINEPSEVLDRGDEEYAELRLNHPVYFYSEKYDHIYINTNGILSFKNPLPNFLNIPFPLDYPAISVFYSNVDTTPTNDSAGIIYFQSSDEQMLQRASHYVRQAFTDAQDFMATALVVVTWENVGHFDSKNDMQNTFQVAIISNDEESFVQYLYPDRGINWVQADMGDDGLPVIRARVGFSTLDGRYFLLKESGTDNIRHLTETSNMNIPGVWLFRVGPLKDANDNIEEPDVEILTEESGEIQTCSNKGRLKCHSNAFCQDADQGFCCICKNGHYGNGYNCIKNDVPIRVSGKITGKLGNLEIDSLIQSYVVMADGRTYTAVSPLTSEVSAKLQLLPILGGVIGWLFAKPLSTNLNGYQITGGKFNHTTTIRFENTNQIVYIVQRFKGLNLWDQLSVDIDVSGDMPSLPDGVRPHIDDFVDEYTLSRPNSIQSVTSMKIHLDNEDPDIPVSVHQDISFESCPFLDQSVKDNFSGRMKTSRTSITYKEEEKALRIVMLSKVGVSEKSNRCSDGTANCGANTICVPVDDENYECNCQNGFAYDQESQNDPESPLSCVDIDECSGGHICSEFAECINELGGYSCRCYDGYYGNGYECNKIEVQTMPPYQPPQTQRPSYPQPTQAPYQPTYPQTEQQPSYPQPYPYPQPDPYYPEQHYPDPRPTYPPPVYPDTTRTPETQDRYDLHCDPDCAENAICYERQCYCKNGFQGNGYECTSICPADQIFKDNQCVPSESSFEVDDYEIEATCYIDSCSCPDGYILTDIGHTYVCRWSDAEQSTDEPIETLSCDYVNNCNEHAVCQYNYDSLKYECVCKEGYQGTGLECVQVEKSCAIENICDPHASCKYDEYHRKSICVCNPGYEGNGISCQLAPECQQDEDCGINSACDQGLCICKEGYERDGSDFCVLAGSCGGAYCAENAECRFEDRQKVSYCFCPPGFVGDGIHECKSIPPPCNVRNNCGLFASCLPDYRNPQIYECVCNAGYEGDGFVCTPEYNCHNIPTLCDPNADCASTTSGWLCVCKQGFMGNGSFCKVPPKLDAGFLIVSQGVAAVKIPLNGGRGIPISAASMAIAIDKDCAEGRVYFSDISAKAIFSAKYDGSDRKVFIDTNIMSPEGIAVDWISRRIYWTDSGKDTVEVASLDNSTLRAVVINKHLVNPRGIAVDPIHGKLFWSDWNRADPKIESANLDGTERTTLVSAPNVKLPNSLAVSLNSAELCFADAGNQKIDCIDTYTNILRTAAANLSYPFGLAITDDQYYWSDWTTKKIESVDMYGVRQSGMQTPLFSSHKMYGMTAVTDNCPINHSPCIINNGNCAAERICLANNRSPSGRHCKCISSSTCEENLNEI